MRHRVLLLLVMILWLGVNLALGQEVTPEPIPTEAVSPTELPLPTEPPPPTLPPTVTEAPPEPTLTPTTEPTATDIPTLEPPPIPTETPTQPVPEATEESTVVPEITPSAVPTLEFLPTEDVEVDIDEGRRGHRGRGAKVSSELLELYDALAANDLPQARQLAAEAEMLISREGTRVRVEVYAMDEAEANRLRPLIESFGGTYLIGYEHIAEYDFPLTMLDALNALPGEFTVTLPVRPQTLNGVAVTQGLGAIGMQSWHARGFRGQGVRIGVIDVGFFGYPNSDTGCVRGASSFDPLPITLGTNGDHGTNVVEIICDLAPQAEVFIASVNSISALNAAVDWLIAQDVRIISMSLQWFGHPGDGTGPVNDIVNKATSRDIIWVNSAGNSHGRVWHGAYTNMSVTGSTYGFTSSTINVMNFGGGNPVLRLNSGCGGDFALDLRWSDWNAARTGNQAGHDLDFYLLRSTNGGTTWSMVASSIEDQESYRSVKPMESINIRVSCVPGAIYGVLVRRWSPSAPAYIHIESHIHNLQTPSDTGSIVTPADNPTVVAVAASEVRPHTGWGWSPQRYPDVAPYSSRGPALGPGGTNPAGGTPKPDIAAPTNVRTTRDSQFNGTSAAAPHVAGAFAVLLSEFFHYNKDYLIGMATRSPGPSQYSICNTTPSVCFGQGVLTMPVSWSQWGDLTREHTHHSVILSGSPESVSAAEAGDRRWVTINTAAFPVSQRASGGTFIASRDRYARVDFNYSGVNGVQISYYTMPGWFGCSMTIHATSGSNTASQTVSLDGGTAHERRIVDVSVASSDPWPDVSVRIVPSGTGACAGGGITLDTITPIIGGILQETSPHLTFSGPWSSASNPLASGGALRLTATAGAAAYFWTDKPRVQLVYNMQPDGGIMEVRANGMVMLTIDTYSPVVKPQQVYQLSMAMEPRPPYLIEIVNTGRRNPSSRGQTITLDAIRFYEPYAPVNLTTLTAEALPARPSAADEWSGVGVRVLPVNGGWSRAGSPAALGGAFWSSNTPSAEVMFHVDYAPSGEPPRRLFVYYTGTPAGGQVEVLVNGQVCSACGIIDTYRPVNMPRSVALITLPDSLPNAMTFGLRITGNRHVNSSGTTFIFEGAALESGTGAFTRLSYADAAMNQSTTFYSMIEPWRANELVPSALPGALFNDVHVAANRLFNPVTMTFAVTHETVGLLLARSPQGANIHIEYWSVVDEIYKPLTTVNTAALRTTPRELVRFSRPEDAGSSWWYLLLRGDTWQIQQTGGTPNFMFVDGVVGFGPGTVGRWWSPATSGDVTLQDGRVEQVGMGWTNAPAAISALSRSGALGQPLRRTNVPGASLQFTYEYDVCGFVSILYTRQPDGGIAEVYLDGVRFGEVNFYSPTPLYGQQVRLYPVTGSRVTVEIRNTNRRSPGSAGNWMYVDAISPSPATVDCQASEVVAPYHVIAGLNQVQENDLRIRRIGAGWANLPAAPAGVVGPLGGAAQVVNHPGAVRFLLENDNSVYLVRTLLPNGGLAEVYINGVRCSDCGLVSFFSPTVAYRSPHLLRIASIYGAPPYVIELRALPTRPAGSSGTAITLDAIIPASHGGSVSSIPYTEFTVANTVGSFTTVTLPSSSNGAELAVNNNVIRTTAASGCAYVTSPSDNPRVTVYYTRQPSGGIAEIRTGANTYSLETCLNCGTINTYSPVTQYQVPHSFIAPVTAGQLIAVCTMGARVQGSTGFTIELDAVTFR